ncbi:MAG: zinc-binding dehydrogenase [Ilumatobacteraceae bacterium]
MGADPRRGERVGTAGIQSPKAIRARVAVTCSASKVEAARRWAQTVIDYGSEDFVEAVTAAAGGRGVDVVLDVIGSISPVRNHRATRSRPDRPGRA